MSKQVLRVTGAIYITAGSTFAQLTAGYTNPYTYLIPAANMGLGTQAYPFEWIQGKNVFCDVIKKHTNIRLTVTDYDDFAFLKSDEAGQIELFLGKSVASDNCLVIGYDVSENAAYMQLYGDAPFSGLSISDGGTVHFGGVVICHSTIQPSLVNTYHCGTDTLYWNGVWANYLMWHSDVQQFDALDDLALVRNYKSKKAIKEGFERDVIDFEESFPFLVDAKGFKDPADITGFLFGIARQHLARTEALEKRIAKLEEAN